MTDSLPRSIADYYAGKNAREFTKAVSGFAHDAVVRDEAQQHVGPEVIQRWMEKTAAEDNDQSQILGSTTDGNRMIVPAVVSGSFPGSPIELRYAFTHQDGLITRLVIDA